MTFVAYVRAREISICKSVPLLFRSKRMLNANIEVSFAFVLLQNLAEFAGRADKVTADNGNATHSNSKME